MDNINIYFSDFFNVDEDLLEEYGAVNISLINDLPLFIDPFLLFNSEDKELNAIHNEMISYLKFLQIESEKSSNFSDGMMKAWFMFSEVKQTWLGFSLDGNSGRGLGKNFAKGLYDGLNSIFKSFGKETITQEAHMEKLCLISPNVGRDKISDFTTNFAKKYLLEYTQNFARKYLNPNQCKKFNISKVDFNYKTKSWYSKTYYLPSFKNDFVLLTPKSILTRDYTFINRKDMIKNLQEIAPSISDDALRFELNSYFNHILSSDGKKLSKTEKNHAAEVLIKTHPELIDYYMKYKEEHEREATSISKEKVIEVQTLFNEQLSQLVKVLQKNTEFYKVNPDAYDEAMKRVFYLKHVIEDKDGYKIFYLNGTPIKRESDLQVMFRLVWFGSPLDVNREVNNGRGPVDYKISYGKSNSALVEFKLASNSKLKQNLEKQVEVYKKASDTNRAIKVIMFFTDTEYKKLTKVLDELQLSECPDIVLIDVRSENKISASNVK